MVNYYVVSSRVDFEANSTLAKSINIRSKKYGTHESWKPHHQPLLSSPYSERHAHPTYVLLQNGLGVERDLYHSAKALNHGEPKIISTIIRVGTNLVEKSVVVHNNYLFWISDIDSVRTCVSIAIGMYRHGDHLTAILTDLGAMLETGGSEVTIAAEIQRKKFAKTFWNVTFSSFSTLIRSSPAAIFRPPPKEGQSYSPYVAPQTAPDVVPVLRAILQEMVTLGRALGYPDNDDGLPSSLVDDVHRDPTHTALPSMLLDAQNGLPIEVEVILGEVVRLAKEVGVDVP
ncbi:hypothetical protein BDR04DRAFT_1123914, partial [Suillus decipiens]